MNAQFIKHLRKYVRIKMEEEKLPPSEFPRLMATFKRTYEKADEKTKQQYRSEMERRIAKG